MDRSIERSSMWLDSRFFLNRPVDSPTTWQRSVGLQSLVSRDEEVWLFQGRLQIETERIERAFRRYLHRPPPSQTEDSHELIVCHANVIRYFACRALQIPADAWLRFNLFHCSITHLVLTGDGRVICYSIGDVGHIPDERRSYVWRDLLLKIAAIDWEKLTEGFCSHSFPV